MFFDLPRWLALINEQIPTCLLYDEHGRIMAWGWEAKNSKPMPGTTRCEWFKLFLEPHALRDESTVDPRLPQLPVRVATFLVRVHDDVEIGNRMESEPSILLSIS